MILLAQFKVCGTVLCPHIAGCLVSLAGAHQTDSSIASQSESN